MIRIIKSKILKYLFIRKWKKANKHNSTVPKEIFPPNIVSVGNYSYGRIDLTSYNLNSSEYKLIIGNFVSIASNVKFLLNENHAKDTFTTYPLKSVLFKKSPEDSLSKGSIFINDEVWIGYGATILSGVTIGKGAVIGSCALVTKDIPPYAIAAGVPAKIIRYRFPERIIDRLISLDLNRLPIKVIKENIDLFYKPLKNEQDLLFIEQLYNDY